MHAINMDEGNWGQLCLSSISISEFTVKTGRYKATELRLKLHFLKLPKQIKTGNYWIVGC